MADVVWSVDALDDLDGIIAYTDRFDPSAAARPEQRLRAFGDSLWIFPERGRPGADGTRELPSVRPYVLRYQVAEETVTTLGIRHGRREPLA